jgi:FixJ family two-component response regulator
MAPSHTHAAVRLQAIFLSKPVRREELVTAYDEARARFGDRFASTALDAAAAFLLSDREREVLEQRLRGHLRLEVAARLGITVRTYDTFAQRIKDKMGKPISELGLEQVSEMLAERRSEQ